MSNIIKKTSTHTQLIFTYFFKKCVRQQHFYITNYKEQEITPKHTFPPLFVLGYDYYNKGHKTSQLDLKGPSYKLQKLRPILSVLSNK